MKRCGLILIAMFACSLAIPKGAGAQIGLGLDLKMTYNEQGKAQSLEWFPSPSEAPIEAFEVQGYSDSGAVVYVETVPASQLSAGLEESEAAAVEFLEVRALDASGETLAVSPRERASTEQAVCCLHTADYVSASGAQSATGLLEMSLVSYNTEDFPSIHITVNVTEDGGRPVLPVLGEENFTVTEDGRVQSGCFQVVTPHPATGPLDIVLLIDDTGSMTDVIESIKAKVGAFVDEVLAASPDARFGLVSFRDSAHIDLPLTTSVVQFRAAVNALIADAGGDWEEVPLDAVMLAMEAMPWRSEAQRIFVLITDAPAHHRGDGTTFSNYTMSEVVAAVNGVGGRVFAVSWDYSTILLASGQANDGDAFQSGDRLHSSVGNRDNDSLAKAATGLAEHTGDIAPPPGSRFDIGSRELAPTTATSTLEPSGTPMEDNSTNWALANPTEKDVRVLAEETGGIWVDIQSPGFSAIVDEILYLTVRNRYGIQYCSDDLEVDCGRQRHVVTTVANDVGSASVEFWYTPGATPFEASLVSYYTNHFPSIYITLNVTEEGGQPVRSFLDEEVFTVTEDGRLQTGCFQVIVRPPEGAGSVDIVFLIDDSGSMESKMFPLLSHVASFADALKSSAWDYRLGLVQFGQTASDETDNPRTIGWGLTDDAEEFKSWLSVFRGVAGGWEPGFAAIRLAIEEFEFRPEAQKHFILITDEESDDRDKASTIASIQENSVQVHCAVDCTYDTSNSDYCDETSVRCALCQMIPPTDCGLLFSITDSFDLLFERFTLQLGNTYIVQYCSDNIEMDCDPRHVVTTVANPPCSASVEFWYTPGNVPMIQRTRDTVALSDSIQQPGRALVLSATAVDCNTAPPLAVNLFVRTTGSRTGYTALPMCYHGGELYCAAVLGEYVQFPGLDYYVCAWDDQAPQFDPRQDPQIEPYQIPVGNARPQIVHFPRCRWPAQDFPLEIEATDNSVAISSIEVRYRDEGAREWRTKGVSYPDSPPSTVRETLILPAEALTAPVIEYYLRVKDNFDLRALWPEGAPAVVQQVGICPTWSPTPTAPTPTPTGTSPPTRTPTSTPSPTITPKPTWTLSPTSTPTVTPTGTATATPRRGDTLFEFSLWWHQQPATVHSLRFDIEPDVQVDEQDLLSFIRLWKDHTPLTVKFLDANLEWVIRAALGKPTGDIYHGELATLTSVSSRYKGIVDLTGLQYCRNLATLDLRGNGISEISPLTELTKLNIVDLCYNQICDVGPLINNGGLSEGDRIYLDGNPLSEACVNEQIPALEARGVTVSY